MVVIFKFAIGNYLDISFSMVSFQIFFSSSGQDLRLDFSINLVSFELFEAYLRQGLQRAMCNNILIFSNGEASLYCSLSQQYPASEQSGISDLFLFILKPVFFQTLGKSSPRSMDNYPKVRRSNVKLFTDCFGIKTINGFHFEDFCLFFR